MKRIISALYGIFLETLLDKIHNRKVRFEKEYLRYCRNGCKECYKWNGYCRSTKEGTPYKKFRKKSHKVTFCRERRIRKGEFFIKGKEDT